MIGEQWWKPVLGFVNYSNLARAAKGYILSQTTLESQRHRKTSKHFRASAYDPRFLSFQFRFVSLLTFEKVVQCTNVSFFLFVDCWIKLRRLCIWFFGHNNSIEYLHFFLCTEYSLFSWLIFIKKIWLIIFNKIS